MNKIINVIIWPVLLLPIIYLSIIWNDVPEKIVTRFNMEGKPEEYGSKNDLIIWMPVIMIIAAAIYFLLPRAYKIDPKKTAVANKSRLQNLSFAIAVFMCFVSCMIINSAVQGGIRFNIRLIFGGIGLLWCIIGNYMHNIKPNYFAGIRLPWTLNNEDNWRKTHLLGGKLFFAGGLLITLICIFTPVKVTVVAFAVITIIITLIPGIYSYRLYKSAKKNT